MINNPNGSNNSIKPRYSVSNVSKLLNKYRAASVLAVNKETAINIRIVEAESVVWDFQ